MIDRFAPLAPSLTAACLVVALTGGLVVGQGRVRVRDPLTTYDRLQPGGGR